MRSRAFASAPRAAGLRLGFGLGLALAALLALSLLRPAFAAGDRGMDRWSSAERELLASMSLQRLPPLPGDPSNAVADRPEAAALGRRLFEDTQLSRDGHVACASCHDAQRQFQDGRPVGRGVGEGSRRTMPIADAARSPWLFWDGRKDSLWSQALGPMEDAVEHGSNRTRLVQQLQARHRAGYEAVFGPFPPQLAGLPADAGPLGTAEERRAWAQLAPAQRDAVNRVFANLGKAIAAYERTIASSPTRFDRYVEALQRGDRAGQQLLSAEEVAGMRLFIGKGQCATCHNGPLLTDGHFHNTGVPPRDAARPDRGRAPAVARVLADEFNCLGRYSDAPPEACAELRFIADADPGMEAAFRTPGLRNVAQRAPYMHAGQLQTLEEVVAHYRRAPPAAVGHSELSREGHVHKEREPIRLDDEEARQLVAFLRSLAEAPQP